MTLPRHCLVGTVEPSCWLCDGPTIAYPLPSARMTEGCAQTVRWEAA